MKNCDEMVNSLLERRDRYDAEKKRKKTIVTSTVTSVCCVCLVALLGVGMWKGGAFNAAPFEQTSVEKNNSAASESAQKDRSGSINDPEQKTEISEESQNNKDKDATVSSVAESNEPKGQSIPDAFDYLITRETDFCTAQQLFPNIQECKASNFVKYELEIAMPVNSVVAINYIFTNGKITVHDNTVATFMPSDDLYETRKIEDKTYYVEKGYSASDEHTIIFLDEEKKLVYMASMTNSNGDLKALINFVDLISSHSEGQETNSVDEEKYIKMGMSADWPVYKNVKELTDAGNVILLGKIADISFDFSNPYLYTNYKIDVITSYKGDVSDTLNLRLMGGIKGAFIDEQRAVLGDRADEGIPLAEKRPDLEIGQTYLFVLHQYEDAAATTVNPDQSAFNISDPLAKDIFSHVSAKDIILFFGEDKWAAFEAYKTALD